MSVARVTSELLLLVQLWGSVFLQLSSAETINCTVTRDAVQTLYSVPEFKGTSCHHSWTDSTGHVLANHEEKNETVIINTNRMFQIKGCLEEIHYRRDCIPEGRREATCNTSCSGIAGIQGREEINRHHWFTLAAFLLLLPVGLFLSYKFLNHPHSLKHCCDDAEPLPQHG